MEVFDPGQRSLEFGLIPKHLQRHWFMRTHLPNSMCHYQLGFQGKGVIIGSIDMTQLLVQENMIVLLYINLVHKMHK